MTNKLMDMEKVLKALAYHKRLDILGLLFKKKEAHVCEIADMLELPLVTVSRNLSTLTRANLIRARQKGSFLYYSINPNQDHFAKSILSILKSNLAGKKYLISYSEARLLDPRIRQSLKNFIEPEPER
mgnify:CR=1 FL=1